MERERENEGAERPDRMDRREFLSRALRLGLAGATAAFLPGYNGNHLFADAPAPDVVVVKGKNLRTMLRKALEPFGGIKAFVNKGAKVVLKPNMSFQNKPDWGNVTTPELVRDVAKFCLTAGAEEIHVIDYPLKGGAACVDATGMRETMARVRKTKVRAIVSEDDYREIEVPEGKVLQKIKAAKELEGSVLINLPQAKHHVATQVSLGIKNLMGLVWDRHQFHRNFDISEGLADLASVIKPSLTIVDATRIMTSKGPTGPGDVEQLDTLVVGRAPASVDAVALGLTKWQHRRLRPQQIAHIRLASQKGLGEIDTRKLRIETIEA